MVNTNKLSPEQMAHLLHMVSLATRRKFDADEGSLWLQMLSDYTYDECYEAFNIYIKDRSEDYLTPGLITNIIKTKRRDRWSRKGDAATPPNGMNGDQYLEWLRERLEVVTQPPKAPQVHSQKQIADTAHSDRRALGQ